MAWPVVDITERAAVVTGLAVSSRATTCNTRLAFRCTTCVIRTTPNRHGRADIGWKDNDSMTDWTSLAYVVVDVEGNGQQPPDLVELAAVPIVGGKIGEPSSWLVRPERSNQVLRHAAFTA